MIFLMDVGNSRIKWGTLNGKQRRLESGLSFVLSESVTESLSSAWAEHPRPERVVVSNVAGQEWAARIGVWLRREYAVEAEFVSTLKAGYGVINGYAEPGRLGCDRWVALVALRHGWLGPACVLDVGTAATFDLLDGSGLHRGGVITPGIDLMARSLRLNTAELGRARLCGGDWLGDNTGAAIQSGVINAVAGMAERLLCRARLEMGGEVAAILTGGGAEAVASSLGGGWQLVPDLLLQGLAIIAECGA